MLTLAVAAVLASTNPWSCVQEDARVTEHLRDALTQLRTVTPPRLSWAQRERRAALLDDLARYVEAQRFPRSTGAPGPVFVDDQGRHCAMGALLAWNGGQHIVRHVRATRNLATVPTLTDEPGLAEWLDEHGMTVEEAALVQPTYFGCSSTLSLCWSRAVPRSLVVNAPTGAGSQYTTRPVSSDGQCAGSPMAQSSPVPAGLVFAAPLDLLLSEGRFVPLSWSKCRDPLRVSPSALEQPTLEGCMRQMIAEDPRAMLSVCDSFSSSEVPPPRCADDGRYLAARLPRDGVESAVRLSFARAGFDFDDAGVSLSAAPQVEADAWAHSDDGGVVPEGDFASLLRWDGTNPESCVLLEDGGVENRLQTPPPLPAAPRCSTSLGGAVVLATLLLLRARRIR